MQRTLLHLLAASAAITVSLGGADARTAGTDLHGTARSARGPLADAVIWLDAPGLPPDNPRPRVVLDQRNLMFSPHVLVVRVGTTVEFPNHDRVFHNVFSFRDGKIFDLGLYPVGATQHVVFDHAGLSRLFCNIHPNMAAYIMVVDSPYFAVSDPSGAFSIASVAPGSYAYHAWRPGETELSGSWSSSLPPLAVEWP
jgi:plastocyanin